MPQPPATTANPSQPDDASLLAQLGYVQELSRTLGAFSTFAISLSIICILAGGITSFHIGYCSVGGATIGLGWPLVCVFSLAGALSMAQIASAFRPSDPRAALPRRHPQPHR
jgi:amino acid transporter